MPHIAGSHYLYHIIATPSTNKMKVVNELINAVFDTTHTLHVNDDACSDP